MKVIIDRFEGDFAIVETKEKMLVQLPRRLVPEGAGEGSVLTIEVNSTATRQRQADIKKLIGELRKD